MIVKERKAESRRKKVSFSRKDEGEESSQFIKSSSAEGTNASSPCPPRPSRGGGTTCRGLERARATSPGLV